MYPLAPDRQWIAPCMLIELFQWSRFVFEQGKENYQKTWNWIARMNRNDFNYHLYLDAVIALTCNTYKSIRLLLICSVFFFCFVLPLMNLKTLTNNKINFIHLKNFPLFIASRFWVSFWIYLLTLCTFFASKFLVLIYHRVCVSACYLQYSKIHVNLKLVFFFTLLLWIETNNARRFVVNETYKTK